MEKITKTLNAHYGWTQQEIENHSHNESEKEHYQELAQENAWIGGKND